VTSSWPVTIVIAQTAVSFVLLLTPTGSLPSPRWRWWARVTVAAAAVLAAQEGHRCDRERENHIRLTCISGSGGLLSVAREVLRQEVLDEDAAKDVAREAQHDDPADGQRPHRCRRP
jgi:hypothetical protein